MSSNAHIQTTQKLQNTQSQATLPEETEDDAFKDTPPAPPPLWQVFFLPKSESQSELNAQSQTQQPSSLTVVAFCPFTFVYAEGQNKQEVRFYF
jgi:hypothetical protein